MDKPTYVNGPSADAETVADFRDAAASDLDSVRAFAAEGCVSGLIPDLSASTVGAGEVIVGGNRARAREAVDIDLAGVTRPASGEYRWVAITAAYTTETAGGTLTELPSGTQYAAEVQDSIILALVEGDVTTTGDSDDAVRPVAPVGTVNLCDILFDNATAIGSLTVSDERRTKCPHDRLQDQITTQAATIDAIAAALHAAAAKPNKAPTPAATSTDALTIDATWAAGSVPSGAPAITHSRLRWRQDGDTWAVSRTTTFTSIIRAHSFTVPDADNDVEIQVAYSNSNGFGAWSNIGTIDAADIADPPAPVTRTYSTAGAHSLTWPYPQSTRARLTITGGDGGAGAGGGGGGGAGGNSNFNGGGGGGGGPDGGGGGGGGAGGGSSDDGDGGDGAGGSGGAGDSSGTNTGGAGAGSGDDGSDGDIAGGSDGGDGAGRSGGGGAGGNSDGDGNGGDGANGGGDGGSGAGSGGGGGGGGGPDGGDGGDGGSGTAGDGGGGGGGAQGGDGGDSSVVIAARSISETASGGAGGSGGGGGGGGESGPGDDGGDGGDGNGGAGGVGAGGVGHGGAGGAGGAGDAGIQRIVDVSGLQVGDVLAITVGDGGDGGQGGGSGGGDTVQRNGIAGSNGSDGDAGSVVIEPLTG